MKNRASGFLKQVITILTSMAKAKSLALKNRTRTLKTRFAIFSLLRNRKLLATSISHKLNALMGQPSKTEDEDCDDQSRAIVLYNQTSPMSPLLHQPKSEFGFEYDDDGDDVEKYPDLTHSLFDSKDFKDPGGSVIDLVKHSKEDNGEEFKLEDEIDRVADLFIKRFHRQMRLQKQLSFNNYKDMIERSA